MCFKTTEFGTTDVIMQMTICTIVQLLSMQLYVPVVKEIVSDRVMET